MHTIFFFPPCEHVLPRLLSTPSWRSPHVFSFSAFFTSRPLLALPHPKRPFSWIFFQRLSRTRPVPLYAFSSNPSNAFLNLFPPFELLWTKTPLPSQFRTTFPGHGKVWPTCARPRCSPLSQTSFSPCLSLAKRRSPVLPTISVFSGRHTPRLPSDVQPLFFVFPRFFFSKVLLKATCVVTLSRSDRFGNRSLFSSRTPPLHNFFRLAGRPICVRSLTSGKVLWRRFRPSSLRSLQSFLPPSFFGPPLPSRLPVRAPDVAGLGPINQPSPPFFFLGLPGPLSTPFSRLFLYPRSFSFLLASFYAFSSPLAGVGFPVVEDTSSYFPWTIPHLPLAFFLRGFFPQPFPLTKHLPSGRVCQGRSVPGFSLFFFDPVLPVFGANRIGPGIGPVFLFSLFSLILDDGIC